MQSVKEASRLEIKGIQVRKEEGEGENSTDLWRSVREKPALEPSLAGGVLFRQVVKKGRAIQAGV